MKFKTRLYITFASIAALPIMLFTLCFIVMGKVMIRLRQTGGVDTVSNLVPKSILVSLWISFFIILFIIACLLTRWIGKGVFSPINDLGFGLKQVADGNFDYALDPDSVKGEVKELYKSYEEMRLRLKESAGEKIESEDNNRELITNISVERCTIFGGSFNFELINHINL